MSPDVVDLAQSLSAEEFIGPALALQSLASRVAGNIERAAAQLDAGARAHDGGSL